MSKMFICYIEIDADMTGFIADTDKTCFPTTRNLDKALRFTESEMIKEDERLSFTRYHWFEV